MTPIIRHLALAAIASISCLHLALAETLLKPGESVSQGSAKAARTAGKLVLTNDRFASEWAFSDAGTDVALRRASGSGGWRLELDAVLDAGALTWSKEKAWAVEAPPLELVAAGTSSRAVSFKTWPGCPGFQMRELRAAGGGTKPETTASPLALSLKVSAGARLTALVLHDQTDSYIDGLVDTREYDLSGGGPLSLNGNYFAVERGDGEGLLFLKHAPLPHARPLKESPDLRWDPDSQVMSLSLTGLGENQAGYALGVIPYAGGIWGRIEARQAYERCLNGYDPKRDGRFLSNTWGDRNKDGRIQEDFLLREIEAAARLGVDVVQIDDGWQKGRSKNSVDAGGVWEGFWASDPEFWTPDPGRLPNGLDPLLRAARSRGLELGLWYAIDSYDHLKNWERDVRCVLGLHEKYGISFLKFDAADLATQRGERNLIHLLRGVVNGSGGEVLIDLDVTAQRRLGYFGAPHAGAIFVENRYTDWKKYYPHWTLRNLWLLSHAVDPVNLRMEWLNNQRNREKYGDDPNAPAMYPPDYLFATVMFASPLGWFEVSGLPESYFEQAGPLISTWKKHREALQAGTIYPIGAEPDGKSWTGFASVGRDGKEVLAAVFRENHPESEAVLEIPWKCSKAKVEALHGDGEARWSDGRLTINLPEARSVLFVRISAE